MSYLLENYIVRWNVLFAYVLHTFMPSHASCKSWIAWNLGHANVGHNSKLMILIKQRSIRSPLLVCPTWISQCGGVLLNLSLGVAFIGLIFFPNLDLTTFSFSFFVKFQGVFKFYISSLLLSHSLTLKESLILWLRFVLFFKSPFFKFRREAIHIFMLNFEECLRKNLPRIPYCWTKVMCFSLCFWQFGELLWFLWWILFSKFSSTIIGFFI